jgi:putative zinc finger/helix-turn-helix YgiT family protein
MRIMERYCPICSAFTIAELRERPETYPVRGEPIEVMAQVLYCTRCGEDQFDAEQDAKNLERAYALYRGKAGLLGPTEVKGLRDKYGLTQRGLATVLGWSPATVNRYEKTGVSQTAHNHVLAMLRDPFQTKELLGPRIGLLPPEERQRLEDALEQSLTTRIPETVRAVLEMQKPSGLTGFRAFSLDRLAHMITFFTRESGAFKTKLMKLLWYTDFLHFREQAVGISGAVYVHLPNGPALDNWGLILGILEREGLIQTRFEEGEDWAGDRISGAVKFDRTFFTDSELEVMDAVKRELGHLSSKRLSDRSHLESAWLHTGPGDKIEYQHANELKF